MLVGSRVDWAGGGAWGWKMRALSVRVDATRHARALVWGAPTARMGPPDLGYSSLLMRDVMDC